MTPGGPGRVGAPGTEVAPGTEGVPPSRKARTPSLPARTSRLLVFLALLCLSPIASTQQTPDAPLTRFFQTTQRLQADFTQLEYDADGVLRRESAGRLYLSRPGRFRLDYMQPDDIMIWADGENLSMFDRELEQVTVWRQSTQLTQSAAALLAGEASVLEQYRVSAGKAEDGLQWFDLAGAGADAGEVEVRLALRGSEPAIIEYSDELGSRVQMLLFRLDRSGSMDDDLFNPEIPPGVDIFEAAES